MSRTPASLVALAGTLLMLSACAGLRGTDEATLEAQAKADDLRCSYGGAIFPSDQYTDCRRRLAEQRRDKGRRQLEMASLQAADRVPNEAREPEGVYRPIDPERFTCEAHGEGAARVVFCDEN